MPENLLCYGDNFDILQRYIKDETVDLVDLDPPFKSDQDYNVRETSPEQAEFLKTAPTREVEHTHGSKPGARKRRMYR